MVGTSIETYVPLKIRGQYYLRTLGDMINMLSGVAPSSSSDGVTSYDLSNLDAYCLSAMIGVNEPVWSRVFSIDVTDEEQTVVLSESKVSSISITPDTRLVVREGDDVTVKPIEHGDNCLTIHSCIMRRVKLTSVNRLMELMGLMNAFQSTMITPTKFRLRTSLVENGTFLKLFGRVVRSSSYNLERRGMGVFHLHTKSLAQQFGGNQNIPIGNFTKKVLERGEMDTLSFLRGYLSLMSIRNEKDSLVTTSKDRRQLAELLMSVGVVPFMSKKGSRLFLNKELTKYLYLNVGFSDRTNTMDYNMPITDFDRPKKFRPMSLIKTHDSVVAKVNTSEGNFVGNNMVIVTEEEE